MSDLKRLRHELRTIYEALDAELLEERPELSRRERRDEVRSRLLTIVDEAVREVTAAY